MQKWDLLCGEQGGHMRLVGVQKLIFASVHTRERRLHRKDRLKVDISFTEICTQRRCLFTGLTSAK